MATHSSVLAWRIPGMGTPGGLPSVPSVLAWTQGLDRGSRNSSSTHYRVVFEPGGQGVILCASQLPATHSQLHWALDWGRG